MAKTTSGLETPLRDYLDRLAAFEPVAFPVTSLYLNLTADQHGRDSYAQFCRKAFSERVKDFKKHSPERASFERRADQCVSCQ